MLENAEVRFRCKTEDLEKIKAKAKKIGMSIKSYLLWVGINANIKQEVSI